MRSSLSKPGRVHGALAERGIEDKLIESCLGGEIVQRTAAQIGWVRNLVIVEDCQSHQVRLLLLDGRIGGSI
ncbi:MAG: hypothetical protein WCI81_07230 [Chlorobiaceae bacterium]